MPYNHNDVVKGRIAETLVNELLRACGNKVFRFGYEAILQNLTQLEQIFQKDNETSDIIRSIPDFVVVNKNGEPIFVEVKFRKIGMFYEKEIDFISSRVKYWNCKVILVSPVVPYYRVFDTSSFSNRKFFKDNAEIKFLPIDEVVEFHIKSKILEEFEQLVKKYYVDIN